jgi:RsiW-degrading membrane proteinase PrsW (M82 family)
MSLPFITAVVPVLILLFFIYKKDKFQPEPLGKLVWTFFVGCFSVIPAVLMETGLMQLTPGIPVLDELFTGYVVAGFSEELCKLMLLYWVIWKSPCFDEYFDGIVYAAFLSLGFACVENIGYVLQSDDTMSVALMRGLLAVPAHFLFAVTMGYYFSLAKFDPAHRRSHMRNALLFPLLLHGTYDAVLMVTNSLAGNGDESEMVNVLVAGALTIFFILFDVMMWRWGIRRIKRMQERSKEQNFDRMNPFDGFNWHT